MPSPLTLTDVRRLLARVDDDLAAVRGWDSLRPHRDAWAAAVTSRRNFLSRLAARLDRSLVRGETAAAVARTLDRR